MNLFVFKAVTLTMALMIADMSAKALDGAVVIANPGVSVDNLSAEALKNIYTGKTKYWESGQAIVIVVVADKTDAALQQASGMDPSQFKTFWQRLMFSGRGQEPERVGDAAAAVSIVASTKGAIAIVPADAAVGSAKKIQIQ